MNTRQLLDKMEKDSVLDNAIKGLLQCKGLIDESGKPTVDSFEVQINGVSLKYNKESKI